MGLIENVHFLFFMKTAKSSTVSYLLNIPIDQVCNQENILKELS
jgi:hypothetical protein